MMIQIMWAAVCIVLGIVIWQLKRTNTHLRQQNQTLQTQLEQAIRRLAEYEIASRSKGENILKKSVEGLVALGVPGLILGVAISTSGFAGAAAITSALASIGLGFGMFGGIGVLLLSVLVAQALIQYGPAKLIDAVLQGLISKGESPKTIREKIEGIPSWIIPSSIRNKIEEVLRRNVVASQIR